MSNNADEQELTPMNTLPAMKREIVAILSLTLLAVVGCNDVIHTDAVLISNVGREGNRRHAQQNENERPDMMHDRGLQGLSVHNSFYKECRSNVDRDMRINRRYSPLSKRS